MVGGTIVVIILSLFMIYIGIYLLFFRNKVGELSKKWRNLFPWKRVVKEKPATKWIIFYSILAGIGFIALGIYALIITLMRLL